MTITRNWAGVTLAARSYPADPVYAAATGAHKAVRFDDFFDIRKMPRQRSTIDCASFKFFLPVGASASSSAWIAAIAVDRSTGRLRHVSVPCRASVRHDEKIVLLQTLSLREILNHLSWLKLSTTICD